MFEIRLRKLLGDLRAEPGRVGLMVTSIAVSLLAVGSVLGAYAILTREIAVNYLGTRPASATLEIRDGVDARLLARVRQDPQVARAEARAVVLTRVRVGRDLRPLLLFVIDDFQALQLNKFRPESGAWPPPTGTMLIERAARDLLGATTGQSVAVSTPSGKTSDVLISGIVHDPGLAPAWQEREGYGYVTRATLAGLGEAPVLDELRVEFRDDSSQRSVEAAARTLGNWIVSGGRTVEQIRVPPLHQHPHQRQMTTILFLLLTFSVLALLLSAILVATSLSALLARQVREIGVMKTIGARSSQIVGMYWILVTALGAVSLAFSVPLASAGARAFSRAVATMLNFTLTRVDQPCWVFVVQAAAGMLVPSVVAALPIFKAARITVRQALDRYGVSSDRLGPGYGTFPPAVRNALRRPSRLALTLLLLAAGGAMFMTALNVSRGWDQNLAKVYETRKYDAEIRLHAAEPIELATRLAALPGVERVEAWGYAPAAFATDGQLDLVRTYPDRGHGSLSVLAPPPATPLVHFPLRAGRWLNDEDSDAVVLNHVAFAQANGAAVGERIALSFEGHVSRWRVVGVVEEIGSAGVAYVTDASFARVTGTVGGARLLRVATRARAPGERERTIRAVDRAVSDAGIGIDAALPLTELRTAVGDHIVILIRALLAMALIMAVVGALGLGSTMGISVLERRREFGVMKTLGATPRRIATLVLSEAAFVAGSSFLLALAGALPLTFAVDALVGNLGFLAPLPLVIGVYPALEWLFLTGVVAIASTWLPARRAARLNVREALATT